VSCRGDGNNSQLAGLDGSFVLLAGKLSAGDQTPGFFCRQLCFFPLTGTQNDLVSGFAQTERQTVPHVAGPADYCNFHCSAPLLNFTPLSGWKTLP
jgi:hypothetical protein